MYAAGAGLLGKERQEGWVWQGGDRGWHARAGGERSVGLRVLGTASPAEYLCCFFLHRMSIKQAAAVGTRPAKEQVHEMACFDILMPKSVVGPF